LIHGGWCATISNKSLVSRTGMSQKNMPDGGFSTGSVD
jgi:hypothetical protein